MNKRILICLMMGSTAVFADQPNTAYSQSPTGFYTTVGLGFSSPLPITGHIATHYGYDIYGTVDKATDFSGEVGGGYNLGLARLELTYSYTNNPFKTSQASAKGITERAELTGALTTQTVLVSAYYDWKTASRFVPYLGAGIGYGNIAPSKVTYLLPYGRGVSEAANKGVLAYRAKIGITYLASKAFDVFAEGIYLGSPAYTGAGGFAPDISDMGPSNDFGAKVGIRYHFA